MRNDRDLAAKSQRNYFATKLCLIFTLALARLFTIRMTFLLSKIRLLILEMLNRTESNNKKQVTFYFVNQTPINSV